MTDKEKTEALEPGGSYWKQKYGTDENAQWLRFAEARAARVGLHSGYESLAKSCADFADAMIKEAKRRNRL